MQQDMQLAFNKKVFSWFFFVDFLFAVIFPRISMEMEGHGLPIGVLNRTATFTSAVEYGYISVASLINFEDFIAISGLVNVLIGGALPFVMFRIEKPQQINAEQARVKTKKTALFLVAWCGFISGMIALGTMPRVIAASDSMSNRFFYMQALLLSFSMYCCGLLAFFVSAAVKSWWTAPPR